MIRILCIFKWNQWLRNGYNSKRDIVRVPKNPKGTRGSCACFWSNDWLELGSRHRLLVNFSRHFRDCPDRAGVFVLKVVFKPFLRDIFCNQNIKGFFKNLHKIGYRYLSVKFKKKIIKNFQRRFRQRKIDGILDSETMKISQVLAKKPNISWFFLFKLYSIKC